MTATLPDVDVVSRLAPLVGIMARERVSPSDYDDARQEGLIAAWRASIDPRAEDPHRYAMVAARRAVGDVARGRPGFGGAGRRTCYVDLLKVASLTLDDPDMPDVAHPAAEDATPDRLEALLEWLDPYDANLARLRFKEGMSWGQVADTVGRTVGWVGNRWRWHIMPALREAVEVLGVAS